MTHRPQVVAIEEHAEAGKTTQPRGLLGVLTALTAAPCLLVERR